MTDFVLVGDVGGTKVRFAVVSRGLSGFSLEWFESLTGDDFADFDAALAAYLERLEIRPAAALFALAGPVHRGAGKLTNRDWPPLCDDALARRFGFRQVRLVNDFAAMARGAPELPADAFDALIPGRGDVSAPWLITGAGTGLGVAVLAPKPEAGWRVLESEGGHAAFAPRDQLEFELFSELQKAQGYVSVEHVVSGGNAPRVYETLCEIIGEPYRPAGPSALIEVALSGDPGAKAFCELRARILMGFAGDAAMMTGARGGVVLAGGATRALAPFLRRPEAIARFTDRGAQSAYLDNVPVRLLLGESAPLIGGAALHFSEDRAP
ncbi:MAG: glucokinase [Pseudomonadota bacterium]